MTNYRTTKRHYGNCTYCGESAGWFKARHNECFQANSQARTAIVQTIAKWLPEHPDTTDFRPLLDELTRIARVGYIDEETALAASRDGVCAAVENYLDDNVLSKLEEEHLHFRRRLRYDPSKGLDSDGPAAERYTEVIRSLQDFKHAFQMPQLFGRHGID